MVELLLHRWIKKAWIFPLSAIISGTGISLILNSYLLWPYVLTSTIAIGMKYVFRIGGGHVFNPNNIAIVAVLFFLPQFVVSTPKQWSNGFLIMAFILVLGIIAASMARRLDTVLAFIGSYLMFALLRHVFVDEPLYYALGPMMGASFQLFTFFMLTDPKTTPSTTLMRVVIAFSVAAVDAYLRIHQITNSLFYAAFIVTILIGLPYRIYSTRKNTMLPS